MSSSVLAAVSLTKAYGGVPALHEVSFELRGGEILGVLGENGAGKSTLLNILSGTATPTSGHVALNGRPLKLRSYAEANLNGIWRIFQEPALIPSVSIVENLFLGHTRRYERFGILRKAAMTAKAQQLADTMELSVDVTRPLYDYDFATAQALEVARASLLPEVLGLPSGFVLFDEPTTGLSSHEVEILMNRMRNLASTGAGVAFVSHRLNEVREVCDRVVVLKDGALVASGGIAEFDERTMHLSMVGREIVELERATAPTATASEPIRLRARGISSSSRSGDIGEIGRNAGLSSIDLALHRGEIVGLGGLLGSAKHEILRTIAGVVPLAAGSIELDDAPLTGSIGSRKRAGIAFVPGDRLFEGVIGGQSVASNVSLPSGESGPRGFSNRGGMWRTARERSAARELISSLSIKADEDSSVSTLSGGNQQKVSLARWIYRRPKVLLIENPTAGVDVGAKAEIYRLLRALSEAGTTVLFTSDDLPELIAIGDRVLIMREGRLAGEFDHRSGQMSQADLLGAMLGVSEDGTTK
ncbi:MAG: sugar ABC transporter ATP-binding protein [Mycobacterium sp.]